MKPFSVYTIGTDLRSSEDFIEVLISFDIRNFCDVRSFPRSKITHFNRDALSELLSQSGIQYYFLGRELGGFRKGGYERYTTTGAFREGIERLESIARAAPTVIACAERFPWKCHRKWIARALSGRGWKVEHILDKGKVWTPS